MYVYFYLFADCCDAIERIVQSIFTHTTIPILNCINDGMSVCVRFAVLLKFGGKCVDDEKENCCLIAELAMLPWTTRVYENGTILYKYIYVAENCIV